MANKRKVVLYIATSLDGFIAREDGSIDWLDRVSSEDYDYDEFYNSIDTIIMGNNTYKQILSFGKWPYENKECYVFTRSKQKNSDNVIFTNENIVDLYDRLTEKDGKDIWLLGGSILVNDFINENLIDRYVIYTIPTIIGSGIPLFESNNEELKLNLISIKKYGQISESIYEPVD